MDINQCVLEIQSYIVDGTRQGLNLRQIQGLYAVELAIQSGELELPWSQDELEDGLATGVLELADTQRLVASHPEFVEIAAKWAVNQQEELFYWWR